MQQVGELLREAKFHAALVRLACLGRALNVEGLSALSAWERLPSGKEPWDQETRLLEDCTSDDEAARPPVATLATEIAEAPLAWLQALDQFCRTEYAPGVFACPLQIKDGDQAHWLLPIHADGIDGAYRRQFGNMDRWLHWHRVVPCEIGGLQVSCPQLPHGYPELLAKPMDCEVLRVAIAQFADGATLQWEQCGERHFRVTGLDDHTKREAAILAVMDSARKADAQILVLPELTVPGAVAARITDRLYDCSADPDHDLAVPLVMLGSFHEPGESGWRNHGRLVTGIDGTTLLATDKRCAVTFGKSPDDLCEDLNTAPVPFSMLMTPIGLLALAICKDFFDGHVAQAIGAIGPDWILVPSMSNSLSPHQDASARLGRLHGSRVLVANQPMPGTEPAKHGFLQVGKNLHDTDCENQGIHFHVFKVELPKRSAPPVNKRATIRLIK
ncbi:MAG: hypothetical protein JNJ44_05975 [Zoogloeaceae bacterium]|nr:hypothetical protein [Zoogloeaceae bacterium]